VTNDLGPRCVYLMGYGLVARGDYARVFSRIAGYAAPRDLFCRNIPPTFSPGGPSAARILNKDLKILGISVIISCKHRVVLVSESHFAATSN